MCVNIHRRRLGRLPSMCSTSYDAEDDTRPSPSPPSSSSVLFVPALGHGPMGLLFVAHSSVIRRCSVFCLGSDLNFLFTCW